MLPISLLKEKVSLESTMTIGVGGLVLLWAVGFWIQSRRDRPGKDQRQPHRLDSTLPLLENTLDIIRDSINGNMHHRTTDVGQQFNAEPILIRALGIPDNYLLFTPEAFEDVLKTQFESFPKGPFLCENLRDLLGDGIFAVDGAKWVHQRKTGSHLFTMRSLRDSMTVIIQRHTSALSDILARAADNGDTLDLFKLLNRFTMEAFAEIGFGVRMGSLDADQEHPFQTAFDRAQRALVFRFVRPGWFWKAQRWLGIGLEGQLQRDIHVINNTVLEIIDKALAQQSKVTEEDCHDYKIKDIVSLFIENLCDIPGAEGGVDPTYLRDIVVNFLIAGRDTTAQSLSWFFYNLTENPCVEAAIRKEIADTMAAKETSLMEQASQLVYLEAALKETLRLHPSVPVNPKRALHDATLSDGTFIPAGSTVSLISYSMARMTQVWGPDAEEFKPERWIDPSTGKILSVSASRRTSSRRSMLVHACVLERAWRCWR